MRWLLWIELRVPKTQSAMYHEGGHEIKSDTLILMMIHILQCATIGYLRYATVSQVYIRHRSSLHELSHKPDPREFTKTN